MSGSIFGKRFCLSTWGESHGAALGAVVDGCPAGLELSAADVQAALDKRKPGASPFATARKEDDAVEILSGVFEGRTTGTPISMMIRNTDQRSRDYDRDSYRPGHADYTYDLKYGFRDYRGGGRASARETAARVAGGAIAQKFLAGLGVTVRAYTHSIAGVVAGNIDFAVKNKLNMPDEAAYEAAALLVEAAIAEGDSLGGEVYCEIVGIPPGVGEPVFDKLEAVIGHGVLSIGGVKGITFGEVKTRGSENNDAMYAENGEIRKRSNNAGGTYGGISDGSVIYFKALIKPTPSIAKTQESANRQGESIRLNIKGRHDPLIVPRAVPVVEAMAALAAADLILIGKTSKGDI